MLNKFDVLHKAKHYKNNLLGDSPVKKNDPERCDTIVSITGES